MLKKLYLGTELPEEGRRCGWVHYPVIRLVRRMIAPHILEEMASFTHVLFTSRHAATFFIEETGPIPKEKITMAVGKSTAERLRTHGTVPHAIATDESQEGVVALFRTLDLDDAYLLLPRSSGARGIIDNYLCEQGIRHQIAVLYDPEVVRDLPPLDLDEVEEIIFTSPSTVAAFMQLFSPFPVGKKTTCLGMITAEALRRHLKGGPDG
jgi:uroporphyrinogen-III synthase